MTKQEFKYLCDTYGYEKLPADKKWLSICKITVKDTQRYAVYMYQYYMIGSIYDDSMDNPCFVLVTHKTSDVFNVVGSYENNMLLSAIPLSSIRSITFNNNITEVKPPEPPEPPEPTDTAYFMPSSSIEEHEEYSVKFSYPPGPVEEISLYGQNLTSNPDPDINPENIDDYVVIEESGE